MIRSRFASRLSTPSLSREVRFLRALQQPLQYDRPLEDDFHERCRRRIEELPKGGGST